MVMKKNLFLYIPAVLAVLAVKIYYRTADSDMLLWILAPTAWWVGVLSGIPFEKAAHVGYVSHEYRFIIAASCSGVRFLLLIFAMLVFSFTHLANARGKKICWLGFSAVFSYVAAVFVNGIRITISIYLPLFLMDKKLMSGWLTAERLHTVIGTAVYFSMLFVIYYLARRFFNRFFGRTDCTELQEINGKKGGFIVPVFWYFVMVLGIPFAGRLYRNDWAGFWQYAVLVIAVCGCVALLVSAWGNLWRLKR